MTAFLTPHITWQVHITIQRKFNINLLAETDNVYTNHFLYYYSQPRRLLLPSHFHSLSSHLISSLLWNLSVFLSLSAECKESACLFMEIRSGGGQPQYGGKMTAFVVVSCIMAAMGGVIFGYDIGISGLYVYNIFIRFVYYMILTLYNCTY